MVSVPKGTQEKLPEGGPGQIKNLEWFWTEMHVSLRRLLIYTFSLIFALFNPKVYRRAFKKSSDQFISTFDTFRHKFHYHARFNVWHLIKYSIYLFFQNFRAKVREAFIRGKLNYHKYLFKICSKYYGTMHTSLYKVRIIANYSL